ncbi:MAG TPA: peptidoglycan DD-metalloendopeptidase family protein [Longimicrobiales bacterium]
MRAWVLAVFAVIAAACATGGAPGGPGDAQRGVPQQRNEARPPQLPDSAGWGVHVLALERSPGGDLWAGTYANGMFVLRTADSVPRWVQMMPGDDSTSIATKFVNSIAAASDSVIWYGAVGDGFGYTRDGGRTWHNYGRQLGREWVYVTPDGIVARGDTVYIATADGLRISRDAGVTWRCVQGSDGITGGTPPREAGCVERLHVLPNKYLLAMDVAADGTIWVAHLKGVSFSRDDGRTWTNATGELPGSTRVRALHVAMDSSVWAATESEILVDTAATGNFQRAPIDVPGFNTLPGSPRAFAQNAGSAVPAIATSNGMIARETGQSYRVYYLPAGELYRPAADLWSLLWVGPPYWPIAGSAVGLQRVLAGETPARALDLVPSGEAPADPKRPWLRRPIDPAEGNPYIDQTYRYGSTMAGNLQQHQGVEFNNPAGTPVHAIADGVVAFAGKAEAGANTVAILHDTRLDGQFVFSTYFHNTELTVRSGQRVRAGDVIARVGNTGRAGNDHLHLEVHVAPSADSARIVNAAERFPPFTRNPQLWIAPMPGTGVVAGRVLDSAGNPVQGARIHGLIVPYPEETPFSFAETYSDRTRPDPTYNEHFAVGDVAPGDYLVGTDIEGKRVWRRIRVEAGRVTFVEFRP